ncbi:MAG: hypothetical protein Ct9H90mP8_2460 [Pseudomonadota bacterium]|nr:MAG: hypothetical protein Ct9H90mP8_2460 [Pseudomonadota bacterium]
MNKFIGGDPTYRRFMDINIFCNSLDQRPKEMNPFFEKFHLELKGAFRDPENCFLGLLNAFQQPLPALIFS